jgi:hypothetical protein
MMNINNNSKIIFEINNDFYEKLSIIRGKRNIDINAFVKEILESVINTASFYLQGKDNRNKEYFFENGVLYWREI